MKRNDYTIYHIAHGQFVQRHSLKCHLLPEEKVELFDGTGYPSFAKTVNTCVANCPTEIVIIFSYKVYPFPDEIKKILHYIDRGYIFVSICRFGFFALKKDVFRKIGFLDERFILGGCEDDDFFMRMREANFGMYISHEAIYSNEYSSWTSQFGKERPTASYKHSIAKWKQFPEGKRRQLAEEEYEYELGPSTDQKYLPWNESLVCTYTFENNNKISYNPKEPFNIKDRKLTYPPLSKKRYILKYTEYNNFFIEHRSSIEINQLKNIKNLSYFQLGTNNKNGFDIVKSEIKKQADEFESVDNKKYDIILLDGQKDFSSILSNLNNAIERCNKILMIPGMVPIAKKSLKIEYSGDSYKILYYLLKETELELAVLNDNYGMTYIKMPISRISIPNSYKNVKFEDFKEYMKTQSTYSTPEIIKIIERWT